MAGYSGTPLAKKLGIKSNARICFVDAPSNFDRELDLPSGIRFVSRSAPQIDFILFFVKSEAALRKNVARLAGKLPPDGLLWIGWPKKASGVSSDLSGNLVREIGLECGLVDVKVCAINEVWSGLKFVFRLRDRPRPKGLL